MNNYSIKSVDNPRRHRESSRNYKTKRNRNTKKTSNITLIPLDPSANTQSFPRGMKRDVALTVLLEDLAKAVNRNKGKGLYDEDDDDIASDESTGGEFSDLSEEDSEDDTTSESEGEEEK